MFPQIIRSTPLDTPCLQKSRKKKTRYDCLFFEKNITRRVRRCFHKANIIGVPCKRAQHCCATLRRSQNNRNVGTCCAKSLTGFKLYAASANIELVAPCKRTQQVTTLLGPTMLGVVGQQCCVRLHGLLKRFLRRRRIQKRLRAGSGTAEEGGRGSNMGPPKKNLKVAPRSLQK